MFNHKTLLFATALSLSAAAAYADSACVYHSCEAMGYTKTAADCSGGALVRCPFDTSKVVCRPPLNTPVLALIKDKIESMASASLPDVVVLETSLYDICGNWKTECARDFCEFINGNNITCDYTGGADYNTIADAQYVSDLVNWVENNLMAVNDPCAGAVTFDPKLETCTSYCSSDSSKCMTKKTITCNEAIAKAGWKSIHTANLSSNAKLSETGYYLKEDYTYNSTMTVDNVSFNALTSLPPCAKEYPNYPKLTINGLKSSSSVSFATDTDIRYVTATEGKTVIFNVYRPFRIAEVTLYTSLFDSFEINFDAIDDEGSYDASVGIYCEGGSDGDECYTYLNQWTNDDSAPNVTYCKLDHLSRNNIECNTDNCEEGKESDCRF